MGAWGVALFSDDTACDVRDDYRDGLARGQEGPAVTQELIKKWQATISDEEEGPLFWLALAGTQWELGQLEPDVKKRALEVIATGADLKRWDEEPSFRKQRQAVLAKLADKLNSPQPRPKKLRPPASAKPSPFTVGDVHSFRLKGKTLILLHVVSVSGVMPTFWVFDWQGEVVPSAAELRQLSRTQSPIWRLRDQHLIIQKKVKTFPWDRLTKVGHFAPRREKFSQMDLHDWAHFEQQMLEVFGLIKVPPATRLSHDLGLMGYHVAVWPPRAKETPATAAALFASYASKPWRRDPLRPKISATPALKAFVAEAKAAYPVQPTEGLPTWLADFAAKEGCISIGLQPLAVKKMVPFLRRLAKKHGLTFFDPQKGTLAVGRIPRD